VKAFVLIFFLLSSRSFSQESPKYRACTEKAKTQADMNICASGEAARADTLLNEVYRELLLKAASQTGATAKIKTAEKAWIVYRDAYLEAMYPASNKQAEYGSIYAMEVNLLLAKLTQRQVTALKELTEQYSQDGQ
jgi:uncharacterized protein YecT (DUF1311 family)